HCPRCIAELRRGFPNAHFGVAATPLGPVVAPGQSGPRLDGTILVVDDEADTRDAVSKLLSKIGCRVLLAKDGKEALRLLVGGATPDLILLDLAMPGMGGWEFLTIARANPRLARIPVVIVTGQTDDDNLPAFTRSIRKPVPP